MDRRVERSKVLIKQALLDLLDKKPLIEVTTTELTNKAGINRSTFYTYYHNPQEVFDAIAAEAVENLEQSVLDKEYTMLEFLYVYLSLIRSNRVVFLEIHRFDIKHPIVIQICTLMNTHVKMKKLIPNTTLTDYCNYGFFGIAKEWLEDGCRKEPSVIIDDLKPVIRLYDQI